MRKLLILALAICLLVPFFIVTTNAQEQGSFEEIDYGKTQVISDPALKLSLNIFGQEYPTKKFWAVIDIDSLIDSDSVRITWNYNSTYFLVEGTNEDVVKVRKNQRTTFTKYFIPRDVPHNDLNKKVEFGSRVNAFVENINYLSTTKQVATFNKDFELLPIVDTYQSSKTFGTIVNILAFIVITGGIIAGIFIGVKRFRKYINSEDPET